MALKDLYDNLSDDQRKLAQNAKTPEELAALLQESGLDLTEEQLECLAGGIWGYVPGCFNYGS